MCTDSIDSKVCVLKDKKFFTPLNNCIPVDVLDIAHV